MNRNAQKIQQILKSEGTLTVPASPQMLFDDEEIDKIESWLSELHGNCGHTRKQFLAALLGRTLEGFMGIESDVLEKALLSGVNCPS